MPHTYDDQNIFAKILRGEIPNKTVLETDHSLAFEDVSPQAPVHILVIPKGAYVDADDFASRANDAEIVDYARAVSKVAGDRGLSPGNGGAGYRLIVNTGTAGGQEVPHYHTHIMGGRVLGRMVPDS